MGVLIHIGQVCRVVHSVLTFCFLKDSDFCFRTLLVVHSVLAFFPLGFSLRRTRWRPPFFLLEEA